MNVVDGDVEGYVLRRQAMFNVTIPTQIHALYTAVELLCAATTVFGNSLVLFVFARCRRLRTVTNYYVISLAVADLLIALVGVPSAVATSVGLPPNFHLCLAMNSVLMLLCTGSILSLLAVTVDRFWAIVHPLTYAVDVSHRRAVLVIAGCWTLAAVIGLLPTFGWNAGQPPQPRCFFMEVMDFRYLAFVYFGTIVAPSLLMAVLYALIYRIVRRQVRKMSLQMIPISTYCAKLGRLTKSAVPSPTSSSEAKAAKGIAVIVALFVVSWLPLYTINTVLCFCPDCRVPETLIRIAIVLSHCNSAWNPALYAWGVRDFRAALKTLVCGRRAGGSGDESGATDRRDSVGAMSRKVVVVDPLPLRLLPSPVPSSRGGGGGGGSGRQSPCGSLASWKAWCAGRRGSALPQTNR